MEQRPGDFKPVDDPHRDFDYTTLDAPKQIPAYISDYGAYFFNNWVMQKIPTTEHLGDSVYWRHYIIFDIERSASKIIYNTENGVLSDVLSPDQRTGQGFFPLETGGTDLLFYLDGIAYQLDPVTLKTINRYAWEKTENVSARYGYFREQDGSAIPWKDKRWRWTMQRHNHNPDIIQYMISYYDNHYFFIELSQDMVNRVNFYACHGVNDQFVFIINNTPRKTLDDFTIDYTYKIQQNGLYTIDDNFNLLPLHLNDHDNPGDSLFYPIAKHFEDILFFDNALSTGRYLLFDSVTGMTKLLDSNHIDYIEFLDQNKLIVHGNAFDFQEYLYAKITNPYGNKHLFELYNKNIVIEYEMSDDEMMKMFPDSVSLDYNISLAYNEKINRYILWADNMDLGRFLTH